ncbi:hypothetical protein, partial [Nocardia takedensis]|uniref:hypothetical protein n=1 Tax=Nocardia takedensis TaxID=259390 RepID=UPI001C3F4519
RSGGRVHRERPAKMSGLTRVDVCGVSVRTGIDTVGEALSGVGARWVYPSALSGVDERGVAAAVNWTRIYSQWVGGTPLLRLRGDFTDCAALVGALVAGDGALTARGADPLPDWRGGLLVAVDRTGTNCWPAPTIPGPARCAW